MVKTKCEPFKVFHLKIMPVSSIFVAFILKIKAHHSPRFFVQPETTSEAAENSMLLRVNFKV